MVEPTAALRGEVIEKSINVEWLIHAIISQHYFGNVRIDFVSEILYDEYCSFGLKRRVLLKICPDLQGQVEQQLNRLNAIRNLFAHVAQRVLDSPDRNAAGRVPSPRDFAKSIDFEALHKEFSEIESSLTTLLFAKFQQIGGTAAERAT